MTKASKKRWQKAGLVIGGIILLPFVISRLYPKSKESIQPIVPSSLQKFL